MLVLVGSGISIAVTYYRGKNASVDIRITKARELYKEYNMLAFENNFKEILNLMDSIENIYREIPHYRNSFETAVLYNNRTATYLTMALFKDSVKFDFDPYADFSKDSLILLAKSCAQKSIRLYEDWYLKYDSLKSDSIKILIKDTFLMGLEDVDPVIQNKYLQNRVKELVDAQIENKRRLSVCYTNYGVINRYFKNYKEAVNCYSRALDLWDRNLTAKNNLNMLLGKPLKKRNILQRLFPPDKN